MQREQFDQLLKRAAELCAAKDLVIFGSQSVHALTDRPPAEVLRSQECDIWLLEQPDLSARITAELGQKSAFAETTGVYADPLPPDLPMVPKGWEERLVAYSTGNVTARCLEIHDLIVSKLGAGRLKDYEFIAAVFTVKLARPDEVIRRVQTFPDPRTQAVLLARLRMATEAIGLRLT
ncbi:MAG: hypothetical protein C5B50_18235 [Verrucomicrobia bacterium]|nr:MAG: hypothetical protein C5B50_18235 [Verrucomicrobiota bacterium]